MKLFIVNNIPFSVGKYTKRMKTLFYECVCASKELFAFHLYTRNSMNDKKNFFMSMTF